MFGLNKKLKEKNAKENQQSKKRSKSLPNLTTGTNNHIVPDLICKSFVEGCLVLGCVHDINNTELVVSLPGIGNFGYVKLNNVSKIYTDLIKNADSRDSKASILLQMYNKGDLVRCKVLEFTNKKLYLSVDRTKSTIVCHLKTSMKI